MRATGGVRNNLSWARWARFVFLSALAVSMVVSAQSTKSASTREQRKPYVTPRTPWGDPDLQGLWSNQTSTPLERPAALQGKETLSQEEAEAREEANRLNSELPPPPGDPGTYNSFWREPGIALTRTSLIVDPPDGRVPPFTAEGKARVSERQAARKSREPAGPWENYSNWERCLTRGVIKLNSFYSSSHQIFQAPGYVVIVQELIHESRIVPLDGRPALSPAIRQWMGESRGRWDGDTLVVETTNFNDRNPFRGSGDTLKLVERFTRVGPDAIDYQFTVDDPKIFTRPWTVSMPMMTGGPIFEYACHEGNYSMRNMLSGQASQETAR
jgi:hypothetical protein